MFIFSCISFFTKCVLQRLKLAFKYLSFKYFIFIVYAKFFSQCIFHLQLFCYQALENIFCIHETVFKQVFSRTRSMKCLSLYMYLIFIKYLKFYN